MVDDRRKPTLLKFRPPNKTGRMNMFKKAVKHKAVSSDRLWFAAGKAAEPPQELALEGISGFKSMVAHDFLWKG